MTVHLRLLWQWNLLVLPLLALLPLQRNAAMCSNLLRNVQGVEGPLGELYRLLAAVQ